MRLLTRARALVVVPLILSLAVVAPAADAHDGDHDGPGAEGPTEKSRNVLPLSAVEPGTPGVTQSDLAFSGRNAIVGNYGGFRIIDTRNPIKPRVRSDFSCNGAQSDVSTWDGLLFQSIDAPQSHGGCDSENVTASTPGMFEGIRIFDIDDTANPEHIASIQTDCGSHTHTLLPDEANNVVYVYISSYPLGANAIGPDCQQPHGYVSVIEVPLDDPAAAEVHEVPLDPDTEEAEFDLGAGGTFTFTACHDISVFIELDLAASACMSESQLWDISDPLSPELLWRFTDEGVDPGNIDLWHSSSFSWDGSIVAFGEEAGGGGQPRCVDPDNDDGRIWFLDVETGEQLTNYKIPRSEDGICTMHNFNFVPLRTGENVLVSSAYTGGTTVVDVDALIAGASEADAEIAYYRPHGGSSWSSYWYNGRVYSSDIFRGLESLLVLDRRVLAGQRLPFLNPQTQHNVL